jgi:hypothetical protein
MNRAALADERDFVVIGSQSVLGQFPQAPNALLVSIEADIYARGAPAKSDVIDGAIGELSMFHQTFGYFPHRLEGEQDDRTGSTGFQLMERRLKSLRSNRSFTVGRLVRPTSRPRTTFTTVW